MLVKYHQRVPSLQRYRLQHEDMVVHQVPLDDLYPLVLTELPEETELLEDLLKVSTELFLLHVGSDAWIYATEIIPSIATIFCCIIFFLGTILAATDWDKLISKTEVRISMSRQYHNCW